MHPSMLPFLHKMTGHAAVLLGAGGTAIAVDFNNTITLGSVLVTAAIVAIAGLFTIRAKIADVWRDEAEAERAAKERLQEELTAEKLSHAESQKEQQELRHALKNEVVGVQAQMKVLEMKTDLSVAVAAIAEQSARSEARDLETQKLLKEIRDRLPVLLGT